MGYSLGSDEKISSTDASSQPYSIHIEEEKKYTFDTVLEDHVGKCGRFQLVQFFLICLPMIIVAMHVLSWTFVSQPPIMICDNDNLTDCALDPTQYSAVARWHMYGDRAWIKATIQSFYFLGQMSGSFICGIFADKLGRKVVFYSCIVLQLVSGALLTVAPTWWMFAILKAFTGFSQPGIFGVGLVLVLELVGAEYRRLGTVFAGTMSGLGTMGLALLAYLISDYRILHMVIAAASLFFLSYYWLVPESARWLTSQQRYKEANKIMRVAAKINGNSLPKEWWTKLETQEKRGGNSSFGVTDLFRTPVMRKRSLVCFFVWPVMTMMYYGLTMKSDVGGGSLYINFTISGLIEIPAMFMLYLLIDRIGRQRLVAGGLIVASICLVLNGVIGDRLPAYWGMLQIMFSKGAVTLSYTAMYAYTSELFPTVIRNTAVGCCSTVARIGAISSSYIALWLVDTYGRMFMVLPFAFLSFSAAILVLLFLPETNGKPMPESISQVEGTNL